MVLEILFGAIGFWVVTCAIASALAYVLYNNWAVLQYLSRFLCARAIAQCTYTRNNTYSPQFNVFYGFYSSWIGFFTVITSPSSTIRDSSSILRILPVFLVFPRTRSNVEQCNRDRYF